MAPDVRWLARMKDSTDFPAIDDPGPTSGGIPEPRTTPPGDTADDIGAGQPQIADLDLPGPDDPVAWNYVEPGTEVVGPDGARIGRVKAMLGSDIEGIFHGAAVDPDGGGPTRVVRADDVTALTPSRVEIALDAAALDQAEEHRPPER